MSEPTGTVLVLASYEKGHPFLHACKQLGWRVVLLTSASLRNEARWPTDAIDELFYMHDVDKKWDPQETLRAVSYLARSRVFDRIAPLDDFDVEIAAMLREHLRVPGMGDTTARYFRDKLAMRVRARSVGIRIPEFVHLLNDAQINAFCDHVAPPWVVKPRSSAGAIGIKKASSRGELWSFVDRLGDERPNYVLEQFVRGDVFHVDSLVNDSKVLFMLASRYGKPPLVVSHEGDVFTSRTLPGSSPDSRELCALNSRILEAMHLVRGASHSEFIRGEDGQLYFLETAARVCGAHLADMIEAATGMNPWYEWARIEMAGENGTYALPPLRQDHAAMVISLARQEHPDTSGYTDPEIAWRLDKRYHVGFVLRSSAAERLAELVDRYVERVRADFHAHAPAPGDRPAG